jgi:hypothetical protein
MTEIAALKMCAREVYASIQRHLMELHVQMTEIVVLIMYVWEVHAHIQCFQMELPVLMKGTSALTTSALAGFAHTLQ